MTRHPVKESSQAQGGYFISDDYVKEHDSPIPPSIFDATFCQKVGTKSRCGKAPFNIFLKEQDGIIMLSHGNNCYLILDNIYFVLYVVAFFKQIS